MHHHHHHVIRHNQHINIDKEALDDIYADNNEVDMYDYDYDDI